MNKLYTDLAEVYEAMYQTFIDYEAEFAFYAPLLGRPANDGVLLEIGCGTGHLAPRFLQAGFQYVGLDLSADMLNLARHKHPGAAFVEADMRSFVLNVPVDAAIMAGRTISYLQRNQDVSDCFAAVRRSLEAGGRFCFDFIDAARFIPAIHGGKQVIHRAEYQGKHFFRESFWKPNLDHGWGFDWQSVFYEDRSGAAVRLGEDHSTIRAFNKDEIQLFLTINGFDVLDCLDRPSYAFDTYVIVAQ